MCIRDRYGAAFSLSIEAHCSPARPVCGPVQPPANPVLPAITAPLLLARAPMTSKSNAETLVTVYGGSGFLGRHVVRALAKRNYLIRVAVRRPDLVNHLQPLGRVGQIHAVQANLRYAPSVEAAARDAQVLINLVGLLFERGRQRFDTIHAYGAEQVALAASAHGARLVHVSAIGADEHSRAAYARSKAEAERLVLAAQPQAVIMRPSVIFGPEDDFFNRFAALARTYTDKHGLKDLAREVLGVDLSKQQQLSDWGADELSDAQVAYAATDVLHLHALKEKLDGMLARENRAALAGACFRFLPDRVRLDLAGWAAEDIFSHSA